MAEVDLFSPFGDGAVGDGGGDDVFAFHVDRAPARVSDLDKLRATAGLEAIALARKVGLFPRARVVETVPDPAALETFGGALLAQLNTSVWGEDVTRERVERRLVAAAVHTTAMSFSVYSMGHDYGRDYLSAAFVEAVIGALSEPSRSSRVDDHVAPDAALAARVRGLLEHEPYFCARINGMLCGAEHILASFLRTGHPYPAAWMHAERADATALLADIVARDTAALVAMGDAETARTLTSVNRAAIASAAPRLLPHHLLCAVDAASAGRPYEATRDALAALLARRKAIKARTAMDHAACGEFLARMAALSARVERLRSERRAQPTEPNRIDDAIARIMKTVKPPCIF